MTEENNKQLTDVLLNVFSINKKRYHVLLQHNKIVWEKENSKADEKTTILLHDIITVKLKRCKTISYRNFSNVFINANNQNGADRQQCNNSAAAANDDMIRNSTTSTTTTTAISNSNTNSTATDKQEFLYFSIYYAKRSEKSRKHYNLWRKRDVTFYNNDPHIVKLWYERITVFINEQKRPKCILLFINPFGGKREGLKVYEKTVKPLMTLAGVEVNCIVSQRHNQIRDIILTQSLDIYDAICCVGGDGTFGEVFNGLIFRTIRDLNMDTLRPDFIPKPKIPVGIIPAGSTNTVAYCMHGTTDVRTAAIHIILGQTRGLDLSSFCNGSGLMKFYASVMSYGYLGDVALESEKFRWMGPRRYDYSGFKKLLLNGGYEGEITYLAQDDENSGNLKTKCTVDCVHCLNTSKDHLEHNKKAPHFNYNNLSADNVVIKTQNSSEGSGDGPDETKKSNMDGGNEWRNVKGNFFMISSANICCASARSLNGLSPYCHLGDGYIDIVLVRHTNVTNNIRLLLTLINERGDVSNLPFVEIYRTRKFYFRTPQKLATEDDMNLGGSLQPISNTNDNNNKISQWNCDGEVIHDSDVFISSHCQLIDVFMRGPYLESTDKTTKCTKFCNS